MRKIYMNVADGDECRIAVLEDGRLYEFFIDRPSQLKHVGNIYKGVIDNVEPGIQAAFVDVGLERNGFLHVSDVSYSYQDNADVKQLYPRTLRIKEVPPADTVLAQRAERDVEQVDEFVGAGQSNAEARNGATEAEFLDKLDEEHPGHPVTDSPLAVTTPGPAATAAPITDAPPITISTGTEQAPQAPAPVAAPNPVSEIVSSALAAITGGQPPQTGEGRRRRRRRGRRGGRDRGNNQSGPYPAVPAPQGQSSQGEANTAPEQTPAPQANMFEPPAPQQEAPQTSEAPAAPIAIPAQPDSPAEQAESAQAPAEPRKRRVRTPKKRGGHLPKRVTEQFVKDPTNEEQTGSEPPHAPSGGDGMSGGDGSPFPGALLRWHRPPLPKLQNLLKRGQEVVVQVTKASQGGKGPGLSTFVSLPGRYMVLTPNSNRGGVSRKIEDGGARNELRHMLDKLPVPEGMGVIVRTAAINRTFEDLHRDLNYLVRVWSVISERIHDTGAPALLYTDSDPAIRAVRDYFTADTEEIIIDDKVVFDRVVAFFDQLMPTFRDRVKLYESDVPLFFNAGLENQVEHLFDKKVNLKSGGYLYVEQTEALISIDVNSGKFTSAGDAERTAYQTNLEAIPEICRQLRLRDLGGIVCCDLIDMENAKHRSEIEHALRRELRKDRARTKVARMSPFGVIEMTRQRVRPSIKNYTYVGCPTCNSFGMVRSAETMCLSLLRRMKVALIEQRVFELAVQVHPHVLSHLHSEFRDDIDELEDRFDKRIVFEYAKDLILGQSRFFYVNDRGVRVLYDMDQRINSFAGSGPKVHSNVPLPPTPTGAGPQQQQPQGERRGRRRRGGRRQREREQERMQREQRIKQDAGKAVSFGDTLPEAKMEVIREQAPQPQPQGQPRAPGAPGEPGRGRRRGRRGGRRQRERGAQPGTQTVQGAAPSAQPQAPAPETQPVAAPEPVAAPVEAPVAAMPEQGDKTVKKPVKKKPVRKIAIKPLVKKKPAARRKAAKKKVG